MTIDPTPSVSPLALVQTVLSPLFFGTSYTGVRLAFHTETDTHATPRTPATLHSRSTALYFLVFGVPNSFPREHEEPAEKYEGAAPASTPSRGVPPGRRAPREWDQRSLSPRGDTEWARAEGSLAPPFCLRTRAGRGEGRERRRRRRRRREREREMSLTEGESDSRAVRDRERERKRDTYRSRSQ